MRTLTVTVEAKPATQRQPPDWWPAVENILNEHGLQAIDFVAAFKAAHRQPLTDAAPELLEALTDLVAFYPLESADPCVMAARAAIAKAEGTPLKAHRDS
jgi:hypothetical protein